jgi:hypothetical protein
MCGHEPKILYDREEQTAMNRLRTTELNTSLTRILPVLAVALVIWTSGAAAQDSLGGLMQQTGSDWLGGKWAGQSDDGQTYQIEYKWEIKNHVLSMHFKGFGLEYHGIIFYKPSEEQVVQITVDGNGGNGKGTWLAEYGEAVMKSEHTDEYGEVSRTGFVYSKVDGQTMKSELYEMDQYGQLADEPGITLEYKRQKTAPKTATAATP